jgi:hypothetical protein
LLKLTNLIWLKPFNILSLMRIRDGKKRIWDGKKSDPGSGKTFWLRQTSSNRVDLNSNCAGKWGLSYISEKLSTLKRLGPQVLTVPEKVKIRNNRNNQIGNRVLDPDPVIFLSKFGTLILGMKKRFQILTFSVVLNCSVLTCSDHFTTDPTDHKL